MRQGKEARNYNKNIDDTSYRLKKRKEEEDKKTTEIKGEVILAHEFYVKYGHAASKVNLPNLKEVWIAKQCKVNLEIKDGILTAYGTYEVESIGSILAATKLGTPPLKTKYKLFYKGDSIGYAIRGTLRLSEAGKSPPSTGLLGGNDDTKQILMVFSDDMSKIDVYQESASHESQKFHELTKQSNI